MTTTIMKDSEVGDAWIREMMANNPPQMVIDPATGLPNGNILTGPVRLAFCDSLFEAKPQMRSDVNSKLKHMSTVLFPPETDLQVFWDEYWRIAAQDFANLWVPAAGEYVGMDNPITDQKFKAKYSGFTPGAMCMVVSSNYKPAIVDYRGNPIIDESKIYAGCWAILAVNAYASGKAAPRKGPRFGLQQIMFIADDTKLAVGGQADPKQTFGGVKVKPPAGAPAAAFGQGAPGAGGPPRGAPPGMSGATGAYYGNAGHGAPAPRGGPPGGAPRSAPPTSVPDDEDLSGMM